MIERDEREPELTLYGPITERPKCVSTKLRARTIPLPTRAKNWIVLGRADNEVEDDENDEDGT